MKNNVKDGNYINIQAFMVRDLKLKGNELLIYAIIYGFSQDSESCFTGGLQYLAEWTNSTKQGVLKVLKKLVDDGLLEKIETNKQVFYYKTIEQSLIVNKVNQSTKFNGTIKQSLTDYETKFNGTIKQSLPNNIYIINNNKNNNKVSYVETEEDKKSETNRTDLLNKIKELKKIVADATGENNGTVEMMMQPRIYMDCIDELLAKIKASDYLMGRKEKKPQLKTFVYKVKDILAGFYDDYKKEESKTEEKKHNFTFDAEIFKFLQENEDFLTDKQQRQYEFMKEELRRNANSKRNC